MDSTILGSGNYNIIYNSGKSTIISSENSYITRATKSTIISGGGNITNSDSSVIMGGSFNNITSNRSGIMFGEYNSILSNNFSVIIGSRNKDLGSITNQGETTLVTNFIISGSVSTINGATYSKGFNGTVNTTTPKTFTIVNGLIVNVV